MYILGVNAHHAGASACLINSGQLVAAVEEERFNRRKYYAGFPSQAIAFVLGEAGISISDVAHIGISRKPDAHLLKKVMFTLSRRPSLSLIRARLENALSVRDLHHSIADALGIRSSAIKAEMHYVEHHYAHMASAFFVSPHKDAAILSIDGMGDFVSTLWGRGRGSQIESLGSINFPHSLGFVYTAVSQWLGFPKYGDEGKVMGLAPYGQPAHVDKLRKMVRLQRDGTFELDLDYFDVHTDGVTMSWEDGDPVLGNLYSQHLVSLLGEPRMPRSEITSYHQDVAASLQAILEEAEFNLVNKLSAETKQTALCMAGGVALNSAFNGKVLPNTHYKEIFIQPAAGDAGTSMGVCFYIWHQLLKKPRSFELTHAYTGPQFDNAAIQASLDKAGLKYEMLDEEKLVEQAAASVVDGKILGWFQGRMEWGPRALGHRSIIADPRRSDMKDILNARIKHREPFRPFAPSIQVEHVGEYFDQTYPDPFMIKVYGVKPEKQQEIPAVTHVDGTGRLQTVDRENSSLYWALIDSFRKKTGIPVVLNTSFNENEPIVCSPQEAIDCFSRTRMDALAIGSFLVKKA